MGGHKDRTDLGLEFGATDVGARTRRRGRGAGARADGGRRHAPGARVRRPAPRHRDRVGVVRNGGVISRVGAPQYTEVPVGLRRVLPQHHAHRRGRPARAYIEELLPDVLEGTVQPGRVFDRTVNLPDVPDGYRAMAERGRSRCWWPDHDERAEGGRTQ